MAELSMALVQMKGLKSRIDDILSVTTYDEHKKMAKELLKNGRSHAKDLYSEKKGQNFEADILMKIEDGRVNFSLEFPKREEKKQKGKKGK